MWTSTSSIFLFSLFIIHTRTFISISIHFILKHKNTPRYSSVYLSGTQRARSMLKFSNIWDQPENFSLNARLLCFLSCSPVASWAQNRAGWCPGWLLGFLPQDYWSLSDEREYSANVIELEFQHLHTTQSSAFDHCMKYIICDLQSISSHQTSSNIGSHVVSQGSLWYGNENFVKKIKTQHRTAIMIQCVTQCDHIFTDLFSSLIITYWRFGTHPFWSMLL